MHDWWSTLDGEIQGALISAGATLMAALLGLTAIVCQIGRQARHAIQQNRDNEATKLKLQVYSQIIETCDSATNAGVQFTGYIRNFLMSIGAARANQQAGLPFALPRARFPELLDMEQAATLSAIKIITAVEQWRIIDPRMDVFVTAINVALYDHRQAFNFQFVPLATRTMPILHLETGQVLPWTPPADQVIAELQRHADAVIEAIDRIGSYVDDFQREMQNLLLGQLFANRVGLRQPIDPRQFTTSLQRRDELLRHFEPETAWGRNKAQIEADVRASLANLDQNRP